MEIEEAIKSLNNIVEYWTYKPTEVESAKLAIEALKKQIPLKTVNANNVNKLGRCPNCKSVISPFKVKFCSECGQKLQWS
ncbi:MAG: hypothetical protein PHT02_00810 [Tissierellia bacterium]|nr:hypothetical protein [Tissierellia bacterium]